MEYMFLFVVIAVTIFAVIAWLTWFQKRSLRAAVESVKQAGDDELATWSFDKLNSHEVLIRRSLGALPSEEERVRAGAHLKRIEEAVQLRRTSIEREELGA